MLRLPLLFIFLGFRLMAQSDISHLKPTLLVFSGSDWCLPCIKFDKDVLSQTSFQNFANKHITLLKADFPQGKKQSEERIAKNEALAKKFNPNGIFPKVLLLSPQQKVLHTFKANELNQAFVQKKIKQFILKEYRVQTLLMGSAFEFGIVSNDSLKAQKQLQFCIEKVQRLEARISSWQKHSITSQISQQAGKNPVKVPQDYFQLLKACQQLSRLSQGTFDITFAGQNIWSFNQQNSTNLPDSAAVKESLKQVNFEWLVLNETGQTAFLQKEGMRLNLGAIGKGFAARLLADTLQLMGVKAGLINASGDLCAWGKRANGSDWKVGIANPEKPSEVLYWLPLQGQAVATSGNYEKYFWHQNTRYAHIINAQTGYPLTDKKSVTVFAPNAELADGLATTLFTLPLQQALALVEEMPQIECIIIDAQNKVIRSNGIHLH